MRGKAERIRPFREPPGTSPPLGALLNLGPKSSAWLAAAGLHTVGELRALGPVGICRRLREHGLSASVLLAFALEGALTGCHWNAIPAEIKSALRAEFAQMKRTTPLGRAAAPAIPAKKRVPRPPRPPREPAAPRVKPEHPYAWLWEPLEGDPAFFRRAMFGTQAVYFAGQLVLAFAAKAEPWHGVLVATDRTRHTSLLAEFPELVPHPVLPKWLYLPDSSPRFESTARRLVILVRQRDPRLGVAPSGK